MGKLLLLLVKLGGKIGINNILYKILAPFYHSQAAFSPQAVTDNENYLNSLYQKNTNSCISPNAIEYIYDLQIIIPAYNVEHYISSCLESVLRQQTKYNILVTVINDGSTDDTYKVLKQYENDKRLEIISQKNKGFSGARNTGLRNIRAKYIFFLDSDDILIDGSIETLLDTAYNNTTVDIVEGGFKLLKDEKIQGGFHHKDGLYNKWNGILYGFPWGKIYKADLFKNVIVPENFWFEDTIISMIIYPMAATFATISKDVYLYRRNEMGITFSSKGNKKNLDTLWITKQLLKDREKLGLNNDMQMSEFMLEQVRINTERIATLNNTIIDIANFILSIDFFEQNFGYPENPRLKQMAKAMQKRDLKAFKLACLFEK